MSVHLPYFFLKAWTLHLAATQTQSPILLVFLIYVLPEFLLYHFSILFSFIKECTYEVAVGFFLNHAVSSAIIPPTSMPIPILLALRHIYFCFRDMPTLNHWILLLTRWNFLHYCDGFIIYLTSPAYTTFPPFYITVCYT